MYPVWTSLSPRIVFPPLLIDTKWEAEEGGHCCLMVWLFVEVLSTARSLYAFLSQRRPQLNFQTDLSEKGRFSSRCWISATFWVSWRSLLEDGGKSWGSSLYLGLFHHHTGWIFSMSWCNLDSKCSTGRNSGFQQGV